MISWLKNLYLIDTIVSDSAAADDKNILKIDFDFPAWEVNSKLPFDKFKKNSTYEFNSDRKKIDYIRNEIKTITLGGNDKQRAFGRYLERRISESNFLKKEFAKVI